MIDSLKPRTAIMLAALAVLLVGLLGWFLFISPERSKASALQQDIEAMQTRLELAERVIENGNKNERLAQLRNLNAAMPEEAKVAMPQVLRQLSEDARKAQVRIVAVTPQVAAPVGTYQVLPITLVVDGHYFGIANFLELLRKEAVAKGETVQASGRLYSVDSVVLGGSSAGPDAAQGTLSATLGLNTFSILGKPATAAEAPAETSDTTGAAGGTDG